MSYRPIVDKDEEHAKECLKCGKIFYVGEECPFCTVYRKNEIEKEKNDQTMRVLQQTGLLPD